MKKTLAWILALALLFALRRRYGRILASLICVLASLGRGSVPTRLLRL